MRKKWKRMFSPLTALLCVLAFAVPAFAGEGIDLSREGSVSVGIRAYAGNEAVGGGSLNIYRVAEVTAPEGEAVYAYSEGFEGCDEALLEEERLALSSTAETFDLWVETQGLPADGTAAVDSEGTAYFEGLSAGLYLVTQDVPAEGFNPVNSFLVTVPAAENGTWIYDVDASPKTSPAEKTGEESVTGGSDGVSAAEGVKTGDDRHAAAYLLAGTVSAAAAAAVSAAGRRRIRKWRRT